MPMLKIWFLFSDWCGCETIVTKEVRLKKKFLKGCEGIMLATAIGLGV